MKIIKLTRSLLIVFLIFFIFIVLFFNVSCSSNKDLADTQTKSEEVSVTSQGITTTSKANTPPIAKIKLNKFTKAGINTEFDFDALGSSDDNGDTLTYEWILWDGTKKTEPTFSFLFKEIGDYEIKLIVSDGKSSAENSVTINIVNQPPVLNLSERNISCNVGDKLKLSAKGTTDPEGDNIKITWLLPDNSTLEGEEIEYTVAAVGDSKILVTASDGTDASTDEISITAKESEEQFKKSCENVKYGELLRNPDNYKLKRIHVKGKIVQYLSNMEFHFNITKGSYGFWDDRAWLVLNNPPEENIIEDDIVEVWGFGGGNQEYETAIGGTNTIPIIFAEYVEIIQKAD